MIKRPLYYLLDENKNIIPLSSFEEFVESKIYNGINRIIRHTYLGKILISTVFLGIEHGFLEIEPVLFETMIFMNGEDDPHNLDQYQERYKNYKDALKGHRRAVRMVINFLRNNKE